MTATGESTGMPDTDHQRPHFLKRLHMRLHANRVTGLVTKFVVTVIGTLVLVAGVVMMVTPGPGIVGIIVGLGILATEWEWAQRMVETAKAKAKDAAEKAKDMDPAVRRRRLLVAFGIGLGVSAAVVGYLYLYDWPGFAVDSWDWVQDLHSAVPELPGM